MGASLLLLLLMVMPLFLLVATARPVRSIPRQQPLLQLLLLVVAAGLGSSAGGVLVGVASCRHELRVCVGRVLGWAWGPRTQQVHHWMVVSSMMMIMRMILTAL